MIFLDFVKHSKGCLFILLSGALVISCSESSQQQLVFGENKVDTLNYLNDIDNKIYVPLKINDSVYNFLFDTGASSTLIDSKIKISRESNNTQKILGFYSEQREAKKVWPEQITIGNTQFLNFSDCLQTDLTFPGFLGNNLLNKLCWSLDFVNQKVYVTEDVHNLYRDLSNGIPFELINNTVHIKGVVEGVELPILIDTGDSGASIKINKRFLDENRKNNIIQWSSIISSNYSYKQNLDDLEETSFETIGNITLGDEVYQDELIHMFLIELKLP